MDAGGLSLNYVPFDRLFDDVVHWKPKVNISANATSASAQAKEREWLQKDKVERQASMNVALQAYFMFYGADFDSQILCASMRCNSPPYIKANGDCACADSECAIDLLSRMAQAGGQSSGDIQQRTLERRTDLVTYLFGISPSSSGDRSGTRLKKMRKSRGRRHEEKEGAKQRGMGRTRRRVNSGNANAAM